MSAESSRAPAGEDSVPANSLRRFDFSCGALEVRCDKSGLGSLRCRAAGKCRRCCRPLLTLSDSGRFDLAPRIPYRMSSFVSRGAVLASARLLNQALALLSPLLLVRLLDIVDYGRYRQFMAVAMLVTSLGGFALTANLTYLLARTPERAAADITKTTVLMLAVALLSSLVVAIFRPWIVPEEIAGSWWLLTLYVFMFLNLEVVVAYWLARRRSVEVMQYTLVVTVWR